MNTNRSGVARLLCLVLLGLILAWQATRPAPARESGEFAPRLEEPSRVRLVPLEPEPILVGRHRDDLRMDLAPEVVVDEAPAAHQPPPRVRLQLLRWPDRAPIEQVPLAYFGKPRPRWTRGCTGAEGRLEFEDAPLTGPIELSLLVESFESTRVTLAAPRDGVRRQEVILRPTRGHYGRVVDSAGRPLARQHIDGFWIESSRPVRGAFHGPEELPESDPPTTPSYTFLNARGAVAGTRPTDDEGYYYIEPLGGKVLGQLSLFVRDTQSSSEVLELELPHASTRLPDLVLRQPMEVFGTVENASGAPLPETLLHFSLPGDPSTELVPMSSDAAGSFRLVVPAGGVEVSVERLGYRLESGGEWRRESADGMWQAWRELAPNAEKGEAWFREAYAAWKHPLPRERHQVLLDPFGNSARLVLTELPAFRVRVVDVEGHPIRGASVHMTYGGQVTETARRLTSGEGLCVLPSADRAWQPMLLEVGATGHVGHTLPIPVDPEVSQITVTLHRVDDSEDPEAGDSRAPVLARMELLGPNGPAAGALVQVYSRRDGEPIRSGRADGQGRFEFQAVVPSRQPLYFFAARLGSGSRMIGGTLGPVGTAALYGGEVVRMTLTPAVPVTVRLSGLQAVERYRASIRIAPFSGTTGQRLLDYDVPPGTSPQHEAVVHVPEGWFVAGNGSSRTRGNAPALDFMRADRRHPGFLSMRISWSEWDLVAAAGPVFVSDQASLNMRVEGRISIGGWLLGRPPGETRRLFLVARSALGDWVSTVKSGGSFEFLDVPAGKYHLVLYAHSTDGWASSSGSLLEQGDGAQESVVIASFDGSFTGSRFDLDLEWPEPTETAESAPVIPDPHSPYAPR